MIIPAESLSQDALQNILEEFITREGTDYGVEELSLEEKVARLKPQLESGEVVLIFDEKLQTIHLMDKRQASQ